MPQIRHWLRTGFVASGKIINLHIPQLYSIVRGKGFVRRLGRGPLLLWPRNETGARPRLRPRRQ